MSTEALAPQGLQTVTGRVLTIKPKTGMYGTTNKMTVKLENGSRVWASVPKGATVRPGDDITFTATFERSKDDPSFAFGSRPVMGVGKVGGAPTPPASIDDLPDFSMGEETYPEPVVFPDPPKVATLAEPSLLATLLAELEGVQS